MFVYLSKKIAIPNGVRLRSVAWNQEQGWIACGGENGLLKVLKLDSASGKGGSNLTMNQTLEGHEKAISVVAWNDQHRKLTSSDENGLIIVWMLHKNMWYEEMINNRNRSVVRDLAWNTEGTKVCIVYEDGAVIVGAVDGNRLWGKELKKQLSKVTWSPDGRFLLFGTLTGDVNVHDSTSGQFLTKVAIQCLEESEGKLAGLQWHPAWMDSPDPVASLALCYENGKAQMMRSESDDQPYLVDTGLNVVTMRWNPQGTLLAIGGTPGLAQGAGEKPIAVVQFYNFSGAHLRTLRVPGTSCGGVSWEGTGLRIALAIDSFIFFANVRPDYKWCYFNRTCVYSFQRPEKSDASVMFWNVKSHEKNIKSVRRLVSLAAAADTCLIVSRAEESQTQFLVQLTNSIGAPMNTKYLELEPVATALNSHTVVLCGEEMVYFWQFRNPNAVVDMLDPVSVQQARTETKERMIHIDDVVTPESVSTTFAKKSITNDHICAICCCENYAYIARESGLMHVFKLDPLTLVAKIQLPVRAQSLNVNCNSTTLGVVDLNGVLSLVKLNADDFAPVTRQAQMIQFERKDVWDMRWAEDNPDMFALMEKTRMYVFRGLEPEEPVQSSAHICSFKNLKIRSVLVDECMMDPEKPSKDAVLNFETKSLRDTREILSSVSIKDAFQYVEDHPHPRLWGLLAEAALESLDFTVAEKAVVRCKEYPAIQFVKRIKALDDPQKQRAEVHAFYHRFDEAEKLYKDMDRKDLALELRARLGDWFRVVQLVQEGGGDESIMFRAWENIGDFYADRQKWSKAVQYYSQCKHYEKLARVYYAQEDFRALEKLVDLAGHNKALLIELGEMFVSVGLAESGVNAYLRAGETRRAVDCCVELNQWDQAVALAEKNSLSDVALYLGKYANHLVDKDRIPQAIDLYRKAGMNNEAARLISKLGQEAAAKADPLKAKKYFVLAALEVELFRKRKVNLETKSATQVVDELLSADKAIASDHSLDTAWRGAEAYHFYMLCQQQLYANNIDGALVIAMRLTEYDDILIPTNAYSLVALTSYYAKNFAICSRAFTRLESLEEDNQYEVPTGQLAMMNMTNDLDVTKKTVTADASTMVANQQRASGGASAPATYPTVLLQQKPRKFGDLAIKIFTKNNPVDASVDRARCPQCGQFNKEWASNCSKCPTKFSACIVTGRAITDGSYWECKMCHHQAIESEVTVYKNCPLCHTPKPAKSESHKLKF